MPSIALRTAALALVAQLAIAGDDDKGPARWEAAIRKFEERDRERPPPAGAILFVGSSSIRRWDLERWFPGLDTVNRGFGGSHIADCTHFLDRIVLPHRPREIVLYAGDNDVAAGKTPETVVADFRAFVRGVHAALPSAGITFIAIKPSIRRWSLVDRMRDANRRIRELCRSDPRLKYVDVDAPMIGADGEPDRRFFADDGLHLDDDGYELWARLVRPHLGPRRIRLAIPGPRDAEDSAGGIVAADLTGDGRPDFLVTCRGHVAAYDSGGAELWVQRTDVIVDGQSESRGLPGHHGPGVAAGDVDEDGQCEVVYLTRDGVLRIVDGRSGKEQATARPPVPAGAERWELAMVADFRGRGGDADILLQATNRNGYRVGRYLAAYAFDELIAGGEPLWATDLFVSCAHNGARIADLDGDGRDEVLGAIILSPAGEMAARAAEFRGHIDCVVAADVRPDLPGLEVVLLEEGSNAVQLLGAGGPIWRSDLRAQEPQNAAVGRFREGSDELFIWCRSRYAEHQKPFVFDSRGTVVFEYAMDDVAPEDWTSRGVEVIHTIDWTGATTQLACAKERHRSGDVCVFEPLSGRFVERFRDRADRLYVADVSGDWREEIVVLAGNELRIYQNFDPNPRPHAARLWEKRNYRRLKQCHNYYSP